LSLLVRQRLRPLVSKERREDLAVLQGFIEAGKVTPLIDRACPLGEAPPRRSGTWRQVTPEGRS